MTKSVLPAAFAAFSMLALVRCYGGSGTSTGGPAAGDSPDSGTTTSGLTFHKDVEPILQKNCQGCHVAGGIAPMALLTYDDAKNYAPVIVTQTQARIMPPWGAQETTDCAPTRKWKDDLRLSDADLATLKAWNEGGRVEGDPKDAPTPLTPKAQGLTGVTHTLKPAAPYTMTSATNDEFRCFVLDPNITSTTSYLNGSFFIAGNPQIVHHALLFSDVAGESRGKVTDAATQSYDCQGGAGISKVGLLSAWAPGGVPSEYPPTIGAPVTKGTLLVLQIHYHPHVGGPLPADQTTVQLRFTDTKPQYNVVSLLPGNYSKAPNLLPGPDDPASGPAFVIPANVSGHTETMNFPIPNVTVPIYVYGIGAHMHYVGVSETVKLKPAGQTTEECLLNVPRWDFSWQRSYAYDVDIPSLPILHTGDVLDIKCTYDNTMTNDKLAQSLHDRQMNAPIDVHLGETTLDEMCLAPVSLLYKN